MPNETGRVLNDVTSVREMFLLKFGLSNQKREMGYYFVSEAGYSQV